MIICNYLWLFELANRAILPYLHVGDYLMIIRDYWDYSVANNYQIMQVLFDDKSGDYLAPLIPIIQREKTKCEYPVHNWCIFWHIVWGIIWLIWWLFDDYLWLFVIILWLFDVVLCKCAKRTTHRISPSYAASTHRWPGLSVQRMWSLICLIRHCKASPEHFNVGGEHHANAGMQTRSYSFCIWNSRIARSACCVFGSFDGALATSASAKH